MKARVARRRVRHAIPAKRRVRVMRPEHPAPVPAKKEAREPVAAEPQIAETSVTTFEKPVEFVLQFPEPHVEVIEVFEVGVDEDDI